MNLNLVVAGGTEDGACRFQTLVNHSARKHYSLIERFIGNKVHVVTTPSAWSL
jgi:hypothetical protein